MSEKKAKKLFNSITNISDDIIEEAQEERAGKGSPRWIKWCAAAACLCLVIFGAVLLFRGPGRTDSAPDNIDGGEHDPGSSAGAYTGKIFDGVYYYRADGAFWRYTVGGTPEKLFSAAMSDYVIAEEGVYYTQSLLRLYFQPYDGGEAVKLYEPDNDDIDQVRFSLLDDGTIVLKILDLRDGSGELKKGDDKRASSILIDGKTGETLKTLYEDISFDDSIQMVDYQWQTFEAGGRTLQCFQHGTFAGFDDVTENGVSILPEGSAAEAVRRLGDGILIYVRDAPETSGAFSYLYIMPDGSEVKLSGAWSFSAALGDRGQYLLFFHHDGTPGVHDVYTGKKTRMEINSDIPRHSIVTDGTYLYSTTDHGSKESLWQLEYDENGRPAALILLDEDICS